MFCVFFAVTFVKYTWSYYWPQILIVSTLRSQKFNPYTTLLMSPTQMKVKWCIVLQATLFSHFSAVLDKAATCGEIVEKLSTHRDFRNCLRFSKYIWIYCAVYCLEFLLYILTAYYFFINSYTCFYSLVSNALHTFKHTQLRCKRLTQHSFAQC